MSLRSKFFSFQTLFPPQKSLSEVAMAPSRRNASCAIATTASKARSTTTRDAEPSDQHPDIPDVHIEDVGEGLSSPLTAPGARDNALENQLIQMLFDLQK